MDCDGAASRLLCGCWVPTGPRRACGEGVGSCRGPNTNHAPMRDSRATRRELLRPVVPNQDSDRNPSEPDMASQHPTNPDGPLDSDVLAYD